MRAAYAEAASDILTANDTTTTSATKPVISKGTQDGFSGLDSQLPFSRDASIAPLGNTPGTYQVTFTWAGDTVTAKVGS